MLNRFKQNSHLVQILKSSKMIANLLASIPIPTPLLYLLSRNYAPCKLEINSTARRYP